MSEGASLPFRQAWTTLPECAEENHGTIVPGAPRAQRRRPAIGSPGKLGRSCCPRPLKLAPRARRGVSARVWKARAQLVVTCRSVSESFIRSMKPPAEVRHDRGSGKLCTQELVAPGLSVLAESGAGLAFYTRVREPF